ncbi:MAG TPA: hypothetical protein PKK67_04660 [Cyclobacteriaceae bacterium]|jgi:hypothetical protein|nr:hypothetical protein [Cytophagales bacterium]HNT49854.1 hypothetical protein [Cyclobacteriaceae bacterium]
MKNFLLEITSLENYKWAHWAFIFSAYFVLHIFLISSPTQTNLAVFQAEAFLKGNLHIEAYFWDTAHYKNNYYVTYPPFPALLVTPLVAIGGSAINSWLVSFVVSCLSMFVLYRILHQYMGNSKGKVWVFLAFFFGSPYWYVLITSTYIYSFAHVICTALVLLLLLELSGKQRLGWIAFYWSMAFMTRQMTIFYGIIIIYFILSSNPPHAYRKLALIGLIFALVTSSYLLLNYIRFDNPLETGYSYLDYAGTIKARVESHGLFSYKYFFFNFYHMLVKGHNLIFSGPELLRVTGVDLFGTSILAASPFVLFAVKSDLPQKMKIYFWITFVLILTGLLFYHNNGWMQVNGQRFALDFLPILIVLIATAYKNIPHWLLRITVLYAIGLNILSFAIHAISQ